MPAAEANEATRKEWRNLGFFYDRDDESNSWRIAGTVHGLRKFAGLVRDCALNPKNESLPEHEHFGPYMSLEIGTCSQPEITNHWIASPLEDLSTLASLIESVPIYRRLASAYSPFAFLLPTHYDLIVEVKDDAFDPAREDPQCCRSVYAHSIHSQTHSVLDRPINGELMFARQTNRTEVRYG